MCPFFVSNNLEKHLATTNLFTDTLPEELELSIDRIIHFKIRDISIMKQIELVIIFLGICIHIYGHPKYDYYFEQITIADDLSQNYVTCVHQDTQGFIWIGTQNGLNKYDGYRIKEYNSNPDIPNSLSNSNIATILCDSYQQLWIGTNDGLCRYNPQTDDFETIDLHAFSENTSENRHILALYEDKNHVLWIGTAGGMLYAYHWKEKQLECYSYTMERAAIRVITTYRDSLLIGCTHNQGTMHLNKETKQFFRTETDSLYKEVSVTSSLKDKTGQLWIGSYNKGLIKYGENNPTVAVSMIQSLSTISDSLMIIATENNGLREYDLSQKMLHPITVSQKGTNLNSNAVTCLYTDCTNILWVGTTNGGVNKFDPNRNNFKYISLHTEDMSRQSVHSVLAVAGQDEQNLLVGLDNKGLYTYNTITGKILPHEVCKSFPELQELPINTVLHDSQGITWIGTYCNSMKVVGPEPQQSYINRLIDQSISPTSSVKYIYEDSRHQIWIATSQGEVLCYHPDKQTMDKYNKAFNTLINPNVILSLYEDNENRIWAGSIGGLYCYDEQLNDFQHIYLPDKENMFVHKNIIIPICQTEKDALWLGTQDGLVQYFPKTKQTKHYSLKEGLPGNKIKGLLYDEKNNHLWISTDKGLSYLNLDNKTFTNFGLEDGIVNREFNNMSFLRNKNGDFFFGSVNGIYYFRPQQIITNPTIPKVTIINCQFYDNPRQEKGIQEIYSIPVNPGKEIRIPYSKSIFSINYVALNYTNTKKNKYAYRLENYDNTWRYVEGQRMATFTNLDPGTYYFQVIASNNDGIWNKEGCTLKIIILPPWWRTVWAYAVYTMMVISLLYLLSHFYTNRIKIKSQLANERFERKQLEKLNQLKMQFFSNITHEFRTPLTLILSPLDSMLNQRVGKSVQNDYLKIIQNNAIKLLGFVNELLDFSKSEAGYFSLKPVSSDLNIMLENELHTFLPLAEGKHIKLQYRCYEPSLICLADTVIIQKIVSNLLSNAIKHTPEGGNIHLSLRKMNDMEPKIQICVQDSGKGIPEDQQQLIFERFYQMKEDATNGTGIGLALVKNLVDLHHGNIRVESRVGTGSKFIVEIPFIPSSVPVEIPIGEQTENKEIQPIIQSPVNEKREGEEEKIKYYTVLIAEDNQELCIYISSLLSNSYNVLIAENGKIALEIARKELPDIILSDIFMPEMDGKEFCRCIKQDIHTCHIPFIMLSALASETYQMEGLAVGADDYLTKPFNPDILLSKLSNALQSRALISRRNSTLQALQPQGVTSTDKDSRFLLQLIEIIKANLSNSDLKIDDLGKELGMSHTPFYKKIKQLTNQTPNDFLKNIRLEQARKLLTDKNLNISEIAYLTGFSSPKYFRECFKKQYGQSPSEYLEHQKKEE